MLKIQPGSSQRKIVQSVGDESIDLAQSLNDQGHVSCEKGDYDGAVNISDMSEFQEQTERIKLIESINSINQMNKIIEVIKSDTEKKSDAVETKQNDFNS